MKIARIIEADAVRTAKIGDNPPPSLEDCIKVLEAMEVDGNFYPSGNYFHSPRHWRDWALISWELHINPMPELRRNFPAIAVSDWKTVQYVFESWRNEDE